MTGCKCGAMLLAAQNEGVCLKCGHGDVAIRPEDYLRHSAQKAERPRLRPAPATTRAADRPRLRGAP
jgi:hypothetical protein